MGSKTSVPYVLPRYVPASSLDNANSSIDPSSSDSDSDSDPPSSYFLPLDCLLYQRRAKDAPQTPERVVLDDGRACQKRHELMRTLMGKRKLRQLASKGYHPGGSPPTVSISDDYANLVIDDRIQVYGSKLVDVSLHHHHHHHDEEEEEDHDDDTSPAEDDNEDPPPPRRRRRRRFDLTLEDGTILSKIDRIIACTGYRNRLDFMDRDLLDAIGYPRDDDSENDHDTTSATTTTTTDNKAGARDSAASSSSSSAAKDKDFAPFLMCFDAFHPDVPMLGFVGMYKGAYFGIVELQARLLSELFRCRKGDDDRWDPTSLVPAEVMEREMRASLTRRRYDRPRAQFPHFDYIGMADTIADLLNVVPNPSTFGSIGSMVTPSFYQPRVDLATRCQRGLDTIRRRQSVVIPRVVLSALVGRWDFRRTIHDDLTRTIQRVHGVVRYSTATAATTTTTTTTMKTNPAGGAGAGAAVMGLRYREDGILELPNQGKNGAGAGGIEVFREYDYVHNDDDGGGALDIHFVENGIRAHRFLRLKFRPQPERQKEEEEEEEKNDNNNNNNHDDDNDDEGNNKNHNNKKNKRRCYWIATSDHLCGDDLYEGTFQIALGEEDDGTGPGATDVIMTYRVKGPNKDYVSVTHLKPTL